ncbi:MAG: phosphatase PAP2 family protein [Muribaculaceae bacterium]|nr:phosphatase PAP2 family protein [Muribaculaceae bacterium]
MQSVARKILIMVLVAILAMPLTASPRVDVDSVKPGLDMSGRAAVAAGTSLVALGSMGRLGSNQPAYLDATPGSGFAAVDVVQYVPLVIPWLAKAAGAPTLSGWGQMAVSEGVGVAILAASVYTIKHSIDAPRPDGSDSRSFPSGHTARAFMGATVVARELGDISPWWAVGAYTVATGVGVSRVIERRHFPTDVVAGAGIGILSAQLGYYVSDLIFKGNGGVGYSLEEDNVNLSSLSVSTGMALPIGRVSIGDGQIIQSPALTAALHGGVALGDRWGASAEVGLMSTPIQIIQHSRRTAVAPLNSVGAMVGGYYRCQLSRIFDLTTTVSAGYYFNFNLDSVDRAVTAGSGTPAGRVTVAAGLRLTDNFSCRLSLGYQLAGYHFEITPSDIPAAPEPVDPPYYITRTASRTGVTSSLLVGLSTAITF